MVRNVKLVSTHLQVMLEVTAFFLLGEAVEKVNATQLPPKLKKGMREAWNVQDGSRLHNFCHMFTLDIFIAAHEG